MTLSSLYIRNRGGVNAFRLLLAIMVFVSHFFAVNSLDFQPALYDMEGKSLNLGFLAVRSFFGISGFVIGMSAIRNSDPRRFFRARAKRIFPAYFLVITFTMLVVIPLVILKLSGPTTDWQSIWASVLRYLFISLLIPVAAPIGLEGLSSGFPLEEQSVLPLNSSLWTLPIEIKAYLLIWFFMKFRINRKYLLFAYLLCLVTYLLGGNQMPFVSLIVPDITLLLTFIGGALIAYFFGNTDLPQGRTPLVLLSICFCIASVTSFVVAELFLGVAVAIALPLLLNLSKLKLENLKDDLSYGTYLFGWPISLLLAVLVPHWPVLLMFLVGFSLTIALAGLSWHLLEKRFLSKP